MLLTEWAVMAARLCHCQSGRIFQGMNPLIQAAGTPTMAAIAMEMPAFPGIEREMQLPEL
jgi:hypothetical protein